MSSSITNRVVAGESEPGRTTISRGSLLGTYRRYAPIYDIAFGRVLEHGRKRMAELVSKLAPESVLEVGVGTGLTLFRYPAQTRVVGVDLSREMLGHSLRRVRQLADRSISLVAADAEELCFPNGSFDCVTLPYVLSVTPDPDRLVSELRRVCRVGGAIVIVNHFSGAPFWRGMEAVLKPLAARVGFRSDFGFDEHILRHGWRVEHVEPVNLLGLSRLVLLRNE